jgi:hypothetical protein
VQNYIFHLFKHGNDSKIHQAPYSTHSRAPEQTSAVRAGAFNGQILTTFFSMLGDLQLKYKFRPICIFSVDETNASTISNKLSKYGVRKVRKELVLFLQLDSETKTSTVVIFFNPAG